MSHRMFRGHCAARRAQHPSGLLVHLDPAVGSNNLGDVIIYEAVSAHLTHAFPGLRIVTVSSRDIGKWSRAMICSAERVVLGGTNALSSNPVFGYRQFAVGFLEYLGLRDVVLLGVGWWQYQGAFGPLARNLYRRVLHAEVCHSVRDDYTAHKLRTLGFDNVINTGCPTMWGLQGFEAQVEDRVVVTLTDYAPNPERDIMLLQAALKRFRRVQFWPQGTRDLAYLNSLSSQVRFDRIEVLQSDLGTFDRTLSEGACYAGTRLHAGIRALQNRCPAYIVPIDNRAAEMARSAPLVLTPPALDSVEPGVNFRYPHQERPEVGHFIRQFQ